MAELIDKNGAIKLIEKEFDMNCLTEWGQGYIDAMNDVKGIIALLPTTTEAEIRAKALDDFMARINKNTAIADFMREYLAEVADELKEEQ